MREEGLKNREGATEENAKKRGRTRSGKDDEAKE